VLVHALLETLDFRRGRAPSVAEAGEVAARAGLAASESELEAAVAMVMGFLATGLAQRLTAAADVRREEPFGFLLGGSGVVVSGFLDVLARERDAMIVVDYKSDRLDGVDPAGVVASEYHIQRLVYALAALKAGAAQVEVVHVFLEVPERPVIAVYGDGDAEALELALSRLAAGVLSREFTVSSSPHRALCDGCPGEGGLCSWPLPSTRREAVDTLF
jgi:ATP-dependent exoDNAse (exonuclease V) beta subunit